MDLGQRTQFALLRLAGGHQLGGRGRSLSIGHRDEGAERQRAAQQETQAAAPRRPGRGEGHHGEVLWEEERAAKVYGAPPVSAHIAPSKAHTAALGRRESKVYEDVINGGRTSFLSAPTIEGMLEGGVPIMKDGFCLGAVGVSGVKSNEDAQIAKAGIAAIGL